MSARPLHVEVAEALGWKAWKEKRGEYALCVTQKPGEREPWTATRDRTSKDYTPVSCAEAERIVFYGRGFPAYDTDWNSTGPLIERFGLGLDCCPWVAYTKDHDAKGKTPLVAVCRLILALHAAGKLREDPTS